MNYALKSIALGFATLAMTSLSFAQNTRDAIQSYLLNKKSDLHLTDADLINWRISDEHSSADGQLHFVYVNQTIEGLDIYNAISTFVISNNEVHLTGNRFVRDAESKLIEAKAQLSEHDIFSKACEKLGLETPASYDFTKGANSFVVLASELSDEMIKGDRMLAADKDGKIHEVWNVNIYENSHEHWWNARFDVSTGELVSKNDWVVSCSFDGANFGNASRELRKQNEATVMMPAPPPGTDTYNVFQLPLESPNHGARSLAVGPFDPTSSPYGWHDDNGVAGEEYTITRGNNVYAYEDANDNNNPGFSPDGGSSLVFDYPLDQTLPANQYWPAAITNLFYMNNMMHDIWYHYGFDEASGNFQENNYGNGGTGGDYVQAEAQDGGGTNNANFATPQDGSRPRMQMYMWGGQFINGTDPVVINSPASVAGGYDAPEANFGPGLPATPITEDLVLVDDGTGDATDACDAIINGAALNGKIAVIRRGSCPFVDKVQAAQDEGAVAVIMVNNVAGAPINMGGTSGSITIPSVMLSQADGEAIILEMASGTVNGTLVASAGTVINGRDGDFDNGIIAHEYGHGISTRLTGGASNSGCLGNAEQMGEGWSDWFGLMLTIEPGDQGEDVRGIGTFASNQPTTGTGIRPAPYSTDFAVNDYTYEATNNTSGISQPHGIGFVWCTMLWDLAWALIEQEGYDSDLYTGTGGNNIAMNLVTHALKLQPCGPGFVDGRDAILAADQQLYGGQYECLIWRVFAKRGLGLSADQGDPDNREDQVEAFDTPAIFNTNDEAATVCQSYTWALNGQTYTQSGIYTHPSPSTALCDTNATLNLTVIPISSNVFQLTSSSAQAAQWGATYQWLDCDNNFAPIAGFDGQTAYFTENGTYAVEVQINGCIDTSDCIVMDEVVGLIETDFTGTVMAFPNPTTGKVTIQLGADAVDATYKIYDLNGRIVGEGDIKETTEFDVVINGAPGAYIIEIDANDQRRARFNILKQ